MATRYGFPKNVWSKGILSTTILFGGCSFTNGLELLDRRKTRYATHVCREFGALQWNEAKVGGGNDYIQRTIFNAILQGRKYWNIPVENVDTTTFEYDTFAPPKRWKKIGNGLNYERLAPNKGLKARGTYQRTIQNNRRQGEEGWPNVVVCMWSGINRLENLRLSECTKEWSWNGLAWEKFALERDTYKATKDSRVYIDKQYEFGEEEYMRGYAMRIRNAHFNLRKTVSSMLAVKYMLRSKGIPQLHYLFSSGQYKPLLHLLDIPTYENSNVWWPTLDLNREQIVSELPFLESEGFYDMTKRLELPIGVKDHPLEEAHEAMAQRIIGDIRKDAILK